MNIYWKWTHPQAIRDVDELIFLIRTNLEKFSIAPHAYQMGPL